MPKLKPILFLIILFMSQSLFAITWKKLQSGDPACPPNYLLVPGLANYSTRDFCVMKYEAKLDSYGTVVSIAAGTPLVSVTRTVARDHCQALGYGFDLISNNQWQTISRNIAGVAANWSNGIVLDTELNRGHSDNAPANTLAASTDDNPCSGTNETCTATTWNSQKRTHILSNGNIIWDFAGNVREWVTNNSTVSNGANGYISTMSAADIRQTRYGATAFCATPGATPYCGMGNGTFASTTGAVIRGGAFSDLVDSGVFAVRLDSAPAASVATLGFRCVFVP